MSKPGNYSPQLRELVMVYGIVKEFSQNALALSLLCETLCHLEIGCRALGWRFSSTTTPGGIFRLHVTTGAGDEIAVSEPSWLAAVMNPEFSDAIETAYCNAVQSRIAEG